MGVERAVLATVLCFPDEALQYVSDLQEDDFSDSRYIALFRAIKKLTDQGKVPDTTAVVQQLNDDKALDKVGGQVEILKMIDEAATSTLLPQYISDLKEKTLRKKLAMLGDGIADAPLEDLERRVGKLLSLLTPGIEEQPPKGSDTNFELRWKLGGHYIIAQVRRLKETSDGRVTARLDILNTFPVGPKYLYQGNFNFLAPRSQTTLINLLSDRLPALEKKTWETLVIGMCHKVLQILDEGSPVEVVSPESTDRPSWVINPLIPNGDPVVFFGKPGSGKSYLVQAIALAISLGGVQGLFDVASPMRVMYLDWETSKVEIGRRIATLAKGVGAEFPQIYYRRCARPLEADVERIRSTILEKEISFLVIDSLGPACGADLNAPEPAIAFFNALRSLGLPAVITAHAPKNPGRTSIYGSIFFEALARSVYEVASEQDEDGTLYVILYHRKSNLGRLQHPMAFRFEFHDKGITCSREDIHNIPEADERRPLTNRIRELLVDAGALTSREIAENLNASVNSIQTALKRMRSKGIVVRLPEHRWGVKTDDLPPF